MNRKKGHDDNRREEEEADSNVVSDASKTNKKARCGIRNNPNLNHQSSTTTTTTTTTTKQVLLQHPCQQQYQRYQPPQIEPKIRSPGKSLVPTNISPKNWRRKLSSRPQTPAPPPEMSRTKRRRRCLPTFNPATTTGGRGSASCSRSGSEPATATATEATTTTTNTNTKWVKKVPIKNNFPVKLFQLVDSYSSSSTTTADTDHPYGKQLQREEYDQDQHNTSTSTSTSTSGEIVSWLPSIDNHNNRPRNNRSSISATATAAAATAALLENSTMLQKLQFKEKHVSKCCFVVWDKDRFMASTLIKNSSLSSMSCFRSLERNLNSWGFQRQFRHEEQLLDAFHQKRQAAYDMNRNNKEKNKYTTTNTTIQQVLNRDTLRIFFHPLFQEGRPDLLPWITRRSPGTGNKILMEAIQKTQHKKNQSNNNNNNNNNNTNTNTNTNTKLVPIAVAPEPAAANNLAANYKAATPLAIAPRAAPLAVAIERTGANTNAYLNHVTWNVNHANKANHTNHANVNHANANDSDGDSGDTNTTNDTNNNANHASNISRRLDVILPSGACLRINQRIPAWAIPAQEAAIEYLYQKHNIIDTTTNNNNMNNDNSLDTDTESESELSMLSKKASKRGYAHSNLNSQQRRARACAKGLSSNSEYDYTSDIGDWRGTCNESNNNADSNADSNANGNGASSCKESLVSDMTGTTPDHQTVERMGDKDDDHRLAAFPQPFSSNRSICEANIGEDRLGSLIQSSERNCEANRDNSFVSQTNNSNNNGSDDSDGTNNRFFDASEDGDNQHGDEDDEEFLVI